MARSSQGLTPTFVCLVESSAHANQQPSDSGTSGCCAPDGGRAWLSEHGLFGAHWDFSKHLMLITWSGCSRSVLHGPPWDDLPSGVCLLVNLSYPAMSVQTRQTGSLETLSLHQGSNNLVGVPAYENYGHPFPLLSKGNAKPQATAWWPVAKACKIIRCCPCPCSS